MRGNLGERLAKLGRDSQALLKPIRRLPLTFCHRDFGHGREETVVIDWDFCGIGQIGIEPQSLVSTATIYPGKPDYQVKETVEIIFDNYLQGLKDSGWRGNPEALRYACMAILGGSRNIPCGYSYEDGSVLGRKINSQD